MLNEQVVLCTNDMGSNHVHLGENKNEKDTYKYKTNTGVMGPLPTSTVGSKYLLVIGDYFYKMCSCSPHEKSRGGQCS